MSLRRLYNQLSATTNTLPDCSHAAAADTLLTSLFGKLSDPLAGSHCTHCTPHSPVCLSVCHVVTCNSRIDTKKSIAIASPSLPVSISHRRLKTMTYSRFTQTALRRHARCRAAPRGAARLRIRCERIFRRFFHNGTITGPRATMVTRSSAIVEGPRDASCQLKSCQLPHNRAETTCTTSPESSISCR